MVELVVYVGSVLHVFVNLAHGTRIQAWVANTGDDLPYRQGTPVQCLHAERIAEGPGRTRPG